MLVKKMSAAALSAVLGLALPTMAFAGNTDSNQININPLVVLSVEAGGEYLAGEMAYSIGYPVTWYWGETEHGYFPFSELTFPLDVAYGTLGFGLQIDENYKIGLTLKKSLSEPDDYMEDRDWITWNDQSRLDIYSDSDIVDFSSTIWDIDATYRFFKNDMFSFAAGFGYERQDYRYDTAGIRQWSPSGLEGYDYEGDGSVTIIYDVDVEMIYLTLDGSWCIAPNFRINGRFAFSPWVDVDDRDEHLLRYDYIGLGYKESTGHMQGTAVIVGIDAEFDITPSLYINGGFDYTDIETDGESASSYSGYYSHTVYEEWESVQATGFAKIGYRFGM